MTNKDESENRVAFFVPGLPVAQPRQRTRVVNSGGRMIAANYTPAGDPVNAFKAAIRLIFSQHRPPKVFDGPLRVTLEFRFPRGASTPKKFADQLLWKLGKKDIDNLSKAVMDALNAIAYHDDRQIVDLHASKIEVRATDEPGVAVEIVELTLQV